MPWVAISNVVHHQMIRGNLSMLPHWGIQAFGLLRIDVFFFPDFH
jgi:hypothetical protein